MLKKFLICSLLAFLSLSNASVQTVYDFNVKNDEGKEVSLSDYKGKVMLIVNTATRCGFTPQYKELEELYQKYSQSGLEILDFPCNQFGQQAPGSIEEIHNFCTAKFNIHFPQFDKIDVNGDNAHPLFTYLKSKQAFGGFDLNERLGKLLDDMMRKKDPEFDKNPDIKWNFTKFLIDRQGNVIKRFEPTDKMADVEMEIAKALNNQ